MNTHCCKRCINRASSLKIFKSGNLLLVVFLATLLLLAPGCQKQKTEPRKLPPLTRLNIFALDEIRSSGFEKAVLHDFAADNNTALDIRLFPDLNSLLTALNQKDNLGKVDVALGFDSAFAFTDSLLDVFDPVPEVSLTEISYDIPKDPQKRLVPYAYANLGILYNEKAISQPPLSFGELQDSRYYSRLAVCDPRATGLGRSSLLWSVALFGDDGFDQLWSSLRKNVRKVYGGPRDALDALRKGECSLMLGYSSIPAWLAEVYPAENHIKSVFPQEGSFQYVESAGICIGAPHRATAIKFLNYLISPDTQQFVMYKLALLPVNGRTTLRHGFASGALNTYTHNRRLSKDLVSQRLSAWLEAWDRLINSLPGI